MTAFDKAWSMLKALEEEQGFTMDEKMPTMYGQDFEPSSFQRRTGTIHPAILGMMRRRQVTGTPPFTSPTMPFPDRRVREYNRNDYMEPNINFAGIKPDYGTIVAQTPRQLMTGDIGIKEEDELTNAGQRKRGSVFDAGHYNKYGYPMVGVAQGDFSPEYRVSNYNKLPE